MLGPHKSAECRNISCTNFLSKVLLEDLRRELTPDDNQYGGLKGSSVNHLLIDMFEAILQPMEGGNPAIVLGIDFEKAFNRLDHSECINQLRALGASETSIALVRSFLTDRSMKVKLGDVLSDLRQLKGGSPQGSILGCLLYCVATQQIGANLGVARPASPGHQPSPQPSPHRQPATGSPHLDPQEPGFGLERIATSGLGIDSPASSEDSFHTAAASSFESTESPVEQPEPGDHLLIVFKYIDDTTLVEPVDREWVVRHITENNPTERVPANLSKEMMDKIIVRAEEIGMRVNCKKTQMIVISPDNGYTTLASFDAAGETITSVESMVLLGLALGGQGVNEQVKFIKDKFRRKFWSLIHLRRAGIAGDHLFKLYAAMVRPVIETNSIVYHSMLTATQANDLEKLQKKALRICYGNFDSYNRILEERDLHSLQRRREDAIRKFTAKTIRDNPRFANKWFRRREDPGIDLRNRRPFIENAAKTTRYQNSPLLYIQTVANDIMTS